MKLLDWEGNVLEWDADEAGVHSSVLRIYLLNTKTEQTTMFVLRPDAALALGSAIREWARVKMAKDGLF